MKRWHRALAVAIALVVINAATQIVIRSNFSAGLYPPQAAIGIPITSTLYVSLVMTPLLLALAVLSRTALRPASIIAALVALYVLAAFVAAGGIFYWAEPFHWTLAAAYALLLLVLIGLAWDDVRVLRPRMAAEAPAPEAPALPALRPWTWYAIGAVLFLYALPYIHNLGCIELPFSSGFDLAVLYLGIPALIVAILGGRWIGASIGLTSARAGALLAGTVLFLWVLVLGQGYVVLANAVLTHQRPVLYEGVIVEKLKDHTLRVQVASASKDVISMQVNEYDYTRLKVGDRFAKQMMLGALQIPYVADCRWLPHSRHGGT